MEVNRDVEQFGVELSGGVELVALTEWTPHKMGNKPDMTDCSNVFMTVHRALVLAEVGNRVPAPTP